MNRCDDEFLWEMVEWSRAAPEFPSLVESALARRRAEIGANVRAAREQAGVSTDQLAVRAGLDLSRLTRIEEGERGIHASILARLADALDVPVTALLKGGGGPRPEQAAARAAERLVRRYGL